MKRTFLAAASGLAFSAFLISAPAFAQAGGTPATDGDHVDANGMPTDRSTPAEHAATADLNNQVSSQDGITKPNSTAANDATYQAQQQQYQQQQQDYQQKMQDHQAAQEDYRNRMAGYEVLRDRYRAERAAYHRGIWPDRYAHWMVARDARLVGERVELITGNRVGTVVDTAHAPGGDVEALLVRLDGGKLVWIDAQDVRYNRADGIVMTNLDSADLHHMADERI